MSLCTKSLTRTAQGPVGSTAGAAKSNQTSTFSYRTDDSAATVETAGYFNGVRGQLAVGDVIVATMAIAGGTPVLKHYVALTVPTSGNVTIGLQTTTAG